MKKKILKSLVALTMIFTLCFGSTIEAEANCVSSGHGSGACLYVEWENIPCEAVQPLIDFVIELEIALGCWD